MIIMLLPLLLLTVPGVSPLNWVILAWSLLYSHSDGGRHWSHPKVSTLTYLASDLGRNGGSGVFLPAWPLHVASLGFLPFLREQLTFPGASSKRSIESYKASYGPALGIPDPYCQHISLVEQVTTVIPDSVEPVTSLDLSRWEAACEHSGGSNRRLSSLSIQLSGPIYALLKKKKKPS